MENKSKPTPPPPETTHILGRCRAVNVWNLVPSCSKVPSTQSTVQKAYWWELQRATEQPVGDCTIHVGVDYSWVSKATGSNVSHVRHVRMYDRQPTDQQVASSPDSVRRLLSKKKKKRVCFLHTHFIYAKALYMVFIIMRSSETNHGQNIQRMRGRETFFYQSKL